MIPTTQTESTNLKFDYHLGYVWLISVVAAMGGQLAAQSHPLPCQSLASSLE